MAVGVGAEAEDGEGAQDGETLRSYSGSVVRGELGAGSSVNGSETTEVVE